MEVTENGQGSDAKLTLSGENPACSNGSTETETEGQINQGEKKQPEFSKLMSHFECPICCGVIPPPIHQCRKGHLLCYRCLRKGNVAICPTCQCNLDETPIPSPALEKIAHDLVFPCSNVSRGCNARLKFEDNDQHKKVCKFKVPNNHLCPLEFATSFCTFEGTFEEIEAHLKQHHRLPAATNIDDKGLPLIIGRQVFKLDKIDGKFDLRLINYQDELFLLICNKRDVSSVSSLRRYEYKITLQLIGDPEKAEEFIYKCEVKGGKRCIAWAGVPLPITEKVVHAFISGDCLILNPLTATFLGGLQRKETGDVLTVHVTLAKVPIGEEDRVLGGLMRGFNFQNWKWQRINL